MTLDFALFHYFPYGGLQRDLLKTAQACQQLGHDIHIYTSHWQRPQPANMTVHVLPVRGASNHRRMVAFQQQLHQARDGRTGLLVGFNKLAGLDIYFASDTCYREKAQTERGFLYRLTPRCRTYQQLEQAVFDPATNTLVLALTHQQIADFQKHYQTPEERFRLLPPGISPNGFLSNAETIRASWRQQQGIPAGDTLLLFVASCFKTKGLDRVLQALAALPKNQRQRTWLLVAGGDQANHSPPPEIATRVRFLGARDDIQQLMLAADLLVHPAYTESAGMVLVEALAAGLPVLTTANCGYACHVQAAQAGGVLASPFQQSELNHQLSALVANDSLRHQWQQQARAYAATTDLYSLHQQAAQIIATQAGSQRQCNSL